MSLFKSKFFQAHHSRNITLSDQTEAVICDGFCRWIEDRKYRNPDDSIENFSESLGVKPEEVAQYLRVNLDIKYATLRCLLRIQDASTMLLLYPHKPLSHIGSLIGYPDLNHFLRQFRLCTRHNPDSWHRHIAAKREAASHPAGDAHRSVNPTLRIWCPIYRNY